MRAERSEDFEGLRELDGVVHGFSLRDRAVPGGLDRVGVLAYLEASFRQMVLGLGFEWDQLITGEQVHGNEVADIGPTVEPVKGIAGIDGLVTARQDVLLGVYVADCAAVYFVDRRCGVVGLAHSGRKGTELGIVSRTLEVMADRYGTRGEDVRVQLSPCIRPPHFEVDFAAEIRRQCLAMGVLPEEVFDNGVSTACDLERYYSYRMEKGKTGRMLALLGRRVEQAFA
ncbi:MAG: polyphenol oxidase family protein [Verrucomicrobiota bacterium]